MLKGAVWMPRRHDKARKVYAGIAIRKRHPEGDISATSHKRSRKLTKLIDAAGSPDTPGTPASVEGSS